MKKTLFAGPRGRCAGTRSRQDRHRAQMVVNDPVHMGVHIGEFAKRLAQWTETVKNYQVVSRCPADCRRHQGHYRSGQGPDAGRRWTLQRQVQADLRKVQSIQDLRLSNPQELFARALAMSGRSQSNQYMPVYPEGPAPAAGPAADQPRSRT